MKWTVLFLLFLSIACKNDVVKIPNGILDKESMKELLVDIHIADGMATHEKISNAKLLNQVKKTYLQSVLDKHSISTEVYEKSLDFYQNNPELMFQVYEQVMVNFSTKEAELNGEKKEIKNDKK